MTRPAAFTDAEVRAAEHGHTLGRWRHGEYRSATGCVSCGAAAVIEWDGYTDRAERTFGDALTEPCPGAEEAA